MTCWYSETNWLDVLYTSVRNTPGRVEAAAAYLTNRRGTRISVEALRLRLRGEADTKLSVEMLDLLVEWMQELRQPHALDVIHARAAAHGLVVEAAPTATGVDGVLQQFLRVGLEHGDVATAIQDALADGKITRKEADRVARSIRDAQQALQGLLITARAAASE